MNGEKELSSAVACAWESELFQPLRMFALPPTPADAVVNRVSVGDDVPPY
jgi:hypothetical protein